MKLPILFIGLSGIFLSSVSGQTNYFKLLWNPNPEPNIVYYKILRGLNPSQLDSLTVSSTHYYYDYTIEIGTVYFYAIQAVNDAGKVSPISEIRQAVVQPTEIIVEKISSSAVRIRWSTTAALSGLVKYGPRYPLEFASPQEVQPTTQHQIELEGLSDSVFYYFSCLSRDASGNLIASQDSFFTLGADVQEVPKIIIYPNPARLPMGTSSIYFSGIPARATIRLFNLMGELMWKALVSNGPLFTWNGKDNRGKSIPSGLYICLIEDEKGKEIYRSTLVIIR